MNELALSKTKITQLVLKQIPNEGITFDNAISKWWYYFRESKGLRLTYEGNIYFILAGIKFTDIPVEVNLKEWNARLLELNKKLPCPYFIHNEKGKPIIRVFDSKIAMCIMLYGDVFKYIKNLEIRT